MLVDQGSKSGSWALNGFPPSGFSTMPRKKPNVCETQGRAVLLPISTRTVCTCFYVKCCFKTAILSERSFYRKTVCTWEDAEPVAAWCA